VSDVTTGSARGWSALAADPRALARVIESAPYAAVLHRGVDDGGYHVVALNDSAAAELDRPAIDVLGLTSAEMVDRDELALHLARYDEVVRTAAPVEYTTEVGTEPDGLIRRCRHRVSPVSDDAGEVSYLFGTWWDITDDEPVVADVTRRLEGAVQDAEARLQESDARLHDTDARLQDAEARLQEGEARFQDTVTQLQESEARFRNIADSAPTLIWTTDRDGTLDSVNRAWREFRGAGERAELEDSASVLHPDDHERVLTTWHTALATRTPYSISTRMLRADGEWRWFKVHAAPRLADGEFTGFIGAAVDITDRVEAEQALRRSEERSRALVENAPDMIIVLNEAGCILEASPSVQRILGLDPADWSDRSVFELIHPDDQERILGALAQNLAEGGVGPVNDFRFRAGDGTWRVLEAIGNNRYDDPSVGGLVVNARDITERRKLEAVGRLAASVAKDFDELVGTIASRAQQVLDAAPESSELRSDLEELAGSAKRATSLVGQLLTFGRRPPTPATVIDVHEVVCSMEPMLRQMLGPAIGLACGGPRFPVWVRVDRAGLEQIVMNLVMNASEACSPSGGQVVVRTESVTVGDGHDGPEAPDWADLTPGRYVVLAVHDDGPGMDDATSDQALEPFFTTKPGQSTGLGLSIVHGTVAGHGGRLVIQTAPGDGDDRANRASRVGGCGRRGVSGIRRGSDLGRDALNTWPAAPVGRSGQPRRNQPRGSHRRRAVISSAVGGSSTARVAATSTSHPHADLTASMPTPGASAVRTNVDSDSGSGFSNVPRSVTSACTARPGEVT